MPFTAYFSNKALGLLFGGTAFPLPNVYVGLSTTVPNNDGSNFTEVTGVGYSRVLIDNDNPASWSNPPSGSQTANKAAVTFPQAGGSWGNVVAFGLFDAPNAGNLLAHAPLAQPKVIGTGDVPSFAVDTLVISYAS